MANLGSDNTPIEGESFGLPSGYAVDEENGDLVIRDTDGTVAMRRADGAAWQLEGSDISGVGAFDSESVNTDKQSFAGISESTPSLLYDAIESPNSAYAEQIQYENNIGTNATTIIDLDADADFEPTEAFLTVQGVKDGDDGIRFMDILLADRGGAINQVASVTNNTPASRSYSVTSGTIQLAMGSDSYHTVTIATATRRLN